MKTCAYTLKKGLRGFQYPHRGNWFGQFSRGNKENHVFFSHGNLSPMVIAFDPPWFLKSKGRHVYHGVLSVTFEKPRFSLFLRRLLKIHGDISHSF